MSSRSGYTFITGSAADDETHGSSWQLCTFSDKIAKRLEIGILTLVIVFVVALLSLPSALHFV